MRGDDAIISINTHTDPPFLPSSLPPSLPPSPLQFTERLSELSEMDLEKMDRTDVVNMTRVVDKFVKNILKYVDEGMDID